MIRPGTDLTVYLCRDPVDMRKQIDGLALLVRKPSAPALCFARYDHLTGRL